MKLSPDSQTLEDFVDNYNIQDFKLSDISTSVIKKLFELLKRAKKMNLKSVKEYFPNTEINNGADIDESLQVIQNDIKMRYNKQFCFEFKIGDRHFYIHMFYPNNSIKSECISTCKKCLIYIYCWLYIANSLAKNEYSKKLTINITFTDHKKQKPPKRQVFDSIHVNTAYTYACREETNINIFRKEEWFKVLIHETFHSMGLDFVCMDNSIIEEKIGDLFPVKKYDIRVYETYCEMWAEIINVLFIAFFGSRRKDFNIIIKKMNKMLAYEAYFSLFQMNKILENYEMNYDDLLSNRKIYRENTYILSYYILKSIFMCFLNIFIEWCHKNNKDIEFNKTDTVLREFGSLVERLYKHPIYLQNVERIKQMKSSDKFVNDTMRMSLYEMG
jgi:hypothetical protein